MQADKEREDLIEEFAEEINRIKFNEMEDYDFGSALKIPLFYNIGKTSILSDFKILFHGLLKNNYDIHKYGEGKIVYLFSSEYSKRQEFKKQMEQIIQINQNALFLSHNNQIKFSLRHFSKLFLIFKWYKQLNRISMRKSDKFFIACKLFDVYSQLFTLKLCMEEYSGMIKGEISLCDVFPTDYCFTKLCKRINISTATLQHAWGNPEIYANKQMFTQFPSDSFLTMGECTKIMAANMGAAISKYIVVGPMELIGKKLADDIIFQNEIILGIALGSYEYRNDNIQILNIVLKLSKRKNIQFYIRLHPSLSEEEYLEYLNADYCLGKHTGTMDDFFEKCSLLIMGKNTTVYMSAVANMLPVFAYKSDISPDLFKMIKWNDFHTVQELQDLYSLYMEREREELNNLMLDTRRVLIGSENVTDAYMRFLKNMI